MHAILWLALAGCAKDKEKSNTAAAAPAAKPKVVVHVPDDANSKAFAEKLQAMDIQDFKPTSSSSEGGEIVYTHLKFRDEGVWAATGYVEAKDEKMDCSETGTWSMEPATSQTTATMTWKTSTTDCVGREPGNEQRVLVTLKDDNKIDADYR
jgi:hypothetical protein